ncbi:zinc-finger protein [Roseobacter sp. OBYS 0001]|nr:zinc-finger protein [Roseobacter sp. OBYS 0001]
MNDMNRVTDQHASFENSDAAPEQERDTKRSMLRGWRRKCPHCGSGPLMKSYLKVNDVCSVCREELYHHRADDGPAYLTILFVGHLMAPLLHVAFVTWRPEPLTLFTIFAVGCVALSLYLLPRLKGAIVGYQWARGMGGFGA